MNRLTPEECEHKLTFTFHGYSRSEFGEKHHVSSKNIKKVSHCLLSYHCLLIGPLQLATNTETALTHHASYFTVVSEKTMPQKKEIIKN